LEVNKTSKDIKTKHTVKDIKLLDKTASGTAHVKNAFIKSKDAAEDTQQAAHSTAENYASDKMSGAAKSAARETATRAKNFFRNPRQKAKQNVEKAKEHFAEVKRQTPKARKEEARQTKQAADHAKKTADTLKSRADTARKTAEQAQKSLAEAKCTLQQTRGAGRQTVQAAKQSVKIPRQAEKTIKTTAKTAKSTAKGTIKTAKKSVKTAERTAKTTVKTAKQAAKAAQKSAQAAAKAAKLAAQASKVAAKVAVQTAKAAVKATIAMVKAAIAAIKGLVALIAAGGWVAVLVIIIICLIGLLVGSIFGIFFSGEDSGSGYTMPMAIQEINQEYADKLTEIRNANAHDEVQMSGTRAEWKEILAVYAVKINTDPENAQDVATMDEEKRDLLASVFWDMNVLNSRTETREVTEISVEDDGNEDFTSTETTVTKTILYITVTHKTADEMAAQYGFSAQQKAQLVELLSDEYASLWSAVLYGIHNGSGDIVAVAISQIGNVNGEPYWSWYGFDSRVAWCATFVSWCANECGYIDAGIIPKFAACQSQGIAWFTERGLYQDSSYIPAPGDIIFFDWEQDGHSDHVGIVEYVEGEVVHTVEGNTSNSVARRSYRLDSPNVQGYGTPMY
jgi:cell wall-associated NlpC family hydrolase